VVIFRSLGVSEQKVLEALK